MCLVYWKFTVIQPPISTVNAFIRQTLVEEYRERVAPLSERVLGNASGELSLDKTSAGESAFGDLIADAEREAARTDFAFAVSGGIRAEVNAGPVTYGELFAAEPFGQKLVRMELSGVEIQSILERQYREGRDRPLQISGLQFAHDPSRPFGDRVTRVTLPDGAMLDPKSTYTVAVEGFLSGGGGGFSEFENGRNRKTVGEDLEALAGYVEGLPEPFTAPNPVEERRISIPSQ